MTEEDPIPIPEPFFEGDFALDEVLALESGEFLDHPTLHYAVYGKLNACLLYTSSCCVAGWTGMAVLLGWLREIVRDDFGRMIVARETAHCP